MENQNSNQNPANIITSSQPRSFSRYFKIIFTTLIVASIFLGGVFYVKNRLTPTIPTKPGMAWADNQQGNLETYSDENLGFEIKYPSDWIRGGEKIAGGNAVFLNKNDYELVIYTSIHNLTNEGIISEQDAGYYHFFENSIAGTRAWRGATPYLPEGLAYGIYRIDVGFPKINTGLNSDEFKYRFSRYIKKAHSTFNCNTPYL